MPDPSTQPAVEVTALAKHFGAIHAVRGLSFSVAYGEVLGFLGPNGAGKSTTMKMISGFLQASAGTVRVTGHDVSQAPVEVKRNIGYLPEGAPCYGEMTVAGFLNFIAEMRGLVGTKRRTRIAEVVESIHLQAVLQQSIDTLSKGFTRRVGMAQAILHDPAVLIMDEPTDGLDPNQKYEVRRLIRDMAQNKAIIISTHVLEEVDALCSRAIIIAAGQKVFDGSPAALRARAADKNIDTAFRELTSPSAPTQAAQAQAAPA